MLRALKFEDRPGNFYTRPESSAAGAEKPYVSRGLLLCPSQESSLLTQALLCSVSFQYVPQRSRKRMEANISMLGWMRPDQTTDWKPAALNSNLRISPISFRFCVVVVIDCCYLSSCFLVHSSHTPSPHVPPVESMRFTTVALSFSIDTSIVPF